MNDDFDEFGSEIVNDDTLIQEDPVEPQGEEDFITSFLKMNGVEDKSKIKFENENGELEEVSWDDLTNSDRINIINSLTKVESEDDKLDDSELELINTIRKSKMSPSEYLDYVSKNSVDKFIQNSNQTSYKIDQYSDEDLYMFDLLTRFPDLTDEEVEQALEQEKSNQTIFSKKMEALRNVYKKAEEQELEQIEFEQKQAQQEQYNQFASTIKDQITNFTDFYGCEVNMDQDEMNELYEFITGFDEAGNNHFAKVLNDPKLVTKMAFSLLNGDQMIEDINSYYKNEISKVREASYKKGLEDGKNKKESNFIIKKTDKKSDQDFLDTDEF